MNGDRLVRVLNRPLRLGGLFGEPVERHVTGHVLEERGESDPFPLQPVIDAVDAADGFAQGLPLAVVAAHRNYDAGGDFGGDVIAVSEDFLDGAVGGYAGAGPVWAQAVKPPLVEGPDTVPVT